MVRGAVEPWFKDTGTLPQSVIQSSYLAGRMIQVNQPDTQQVEYVFNAINRLVSITAPNGNQSNLAAINLQGAQNALRNPSMEMKTPFDTVYDRPRYWGYLSSPDLPAGRSTDQAHSGTHSLSVSGNSGGYAQGDLPVYAGGRYLANVWVTKAADSVSASYTLTAALRDYYANPQTVPASPPATTLDGSTETWTQAAPTRIDVPGDTQATRLHPPLQSLALNASHSSATQSYFDDATLNLLSTCFEYDGENLREVGSPDGGRTRMEYDRFGRLIQMTDPIGRSVTMSYDGLDRLLSVTDSLGQTVSYAYDQTGQLVSVQDPRNQVTAYSYDLLDRLHQITYPDSTRELFNYNAGSDLLTYIDNMNRERIFTYDGAGRLTGIAYESDSTGTSLTYDAVSNLLRRVERNSDVQLFSYDALNRQNGSSYTPSGSSTSQWSLASAFDANGNRTQLDTGATVTGYTNASGAYQTQTTASGTPIWSVPSGGFDAMDRLLSFQDSNGQTTSFGYDVEGRRTSLVQPNGCTTTASYDLVGKLLNLTTTHAATPLLSLNYAYNQASDRLALQTDQASYDYTLDPSGRLIQESVNCFNEATADQLGQGILNGCQLDPNNDQVQLLCLTEPFAGSTINCDQWIIDSAGAGDSLQLQENQTVGLEIRQNDGLYFIFPKAFANQIADSEPPVIDNYGMVSGDVYAYAQNRQSLQAPFDVAVNFANLQVYSTSNFNLSMILSPTSYFDPGQASVGLSIVNGGPLNYTVNYPLPGQPPQMFSTPTSDSSGSFRMRLDAEGTLTMFYAAGINQNTGAINWVSPSGWQLTGFPITEVNLVLGFHSVQTISSGCFVNLRRLDEAGDFASQGSYTSAIYDAGQTVNWQHLDWTQTQPSNTTVAFQIAVSDSLDGPWVFAGPDGTSATSYLQSSNQPASLYGTATYGSGTALATNSPVYGAARYGSSQYANAGAAGSTLIPLTGVEGRYARYQVTLQSGNGIQSPTFSDVRLWFGQTGMLASSLFRYEYDAAGNILGKTTVTPTATTTDVRTVNDLNQILTQTVGGVEWTMSYNASGAMTGKTNGTDTWTYTWNDENRLTNVTGPGSVDVSYVYDSMGRMLSRTSGSTVTTFSWENWDCVAESTSVTGSAASSTTYVTLKGQLHSFTRDGQTYQVHADALGSVRMVTNSNGATVMRADYSGWGNCLSVIDNVPGGMPYQFVGALGVRLDPEAKLVYVRQRWYNSTLQRFISRDLLLGANSYRYAENRPTLLIDLDGAQAAYPYLNNQRKQRCEMYVRQILGFDETIAKKLAAVKANEGPYMGPGIPRTPLPFGCPGDNVKDELSVRGHIWRIREYQWARARAIANWFNECFNPNSPVPIPIPVPVPVSIPVPIPVRPAPLQPWTRSIPVEQPGTPRYQPPDPGPWLIPGVVVIGGAVVIIIMTDGAAAPVLAPALSW